MEKKKMTKHDCLRMTMIILLIVFHIITFILIGLLVNYHHHRVSTTVDYRKDLKRERDDVGCGIHQDYDVKNAKIHRVDPTCRAQEHTCPGNASVTTQEDAYSTPSIVPAPPPIVPAPPPVFFRFVQSMVVPYCRMIHQDIQMVGCGREWVVHGIWPVDEKLLDNPLQLDDGNMVEAGEFLDELSSKWPSISDPSEDGLQYFWSSQWRNHGTYQNLYDKEDYLALGLTLYDRFNLSHYLAHIVSQAPHDSLVFDTLDGEPWVGIEASRLHYELGVEVGGEPVISCFLDDDGYWILTEVAIFLEMSSGGDHNVVDYWVDPNQWSWRHGRFRDEHIIWFPRPRF